ncbi:MAG: histidinol-phosphatase [Saprospiraceae bacterium]|nr:histidinol-phosphatase [Saprospiraceae bacterium]
MIQFNYHTHSYFCDGKAKPEDFVKEALSRNFKYLGFSSHAPVPFDNKWSIRQGELQNYCKEIERLKTKYQNQIEIFLSLEIDYIPGTTTGIAEFKKLCNLDYAIGGVHLVKHNNELWFIDGPVEGYEKGLQEIFKGDIQLAVTSYFEQINEMLLTQKPDIIAHFDKVKMHNKNRFFKENEKWYIDLVDKTLDIIKNLNTIVEINTRGIYSGKCDSLFPSIEILKKCYQLKIPITISSDAHKPEEISAYFPETLKILKDIGFKDLKMFTANGWSNCEI